MDDCFGTQEGLLGNLDFNSLNQREPDLAAGLPFPCVAQTQFAGT
jgi:hypothetical protein